MSPSNNHCCTVRHNTFLPSYINTRSVVFSYCTETYGGHQKQYSASSACRLMSHRIQLSTLIDDRLALLSCVVLAQHALHVLNVPVSSADAKAECALNS